MNRPLSEVVFIGAVALAGVAVGLVLISPDQTTAVLFMLAAACILFASLIWFIVDRARR
jgi:cell division protein FtsW (lipid II flippase)